MQISAKLSRFILFTMHEITVLNVYNEGKI